LFFALQKSLLIRGDFAAERNAVSHAAAKWRADVDLFAENNIPLDTELTRLTTEYDKINGAMTVEYDGKERTMVQMARYQNCPIGMFRQEAWMLVNDRRYQDRERIETIFDQQLKLRQQIAENAGFENYREFTWKSLKRFDYVPEHAWSLRMRWQMTAFRS